MADERTLRILLGCLAVVGIGISGYLTVVHYQDGSPLCLAGGEGCSKVQESRYADLAGVPVPLVGLFGYVAVLAMAAARGDVARFGGLFVGLIGAGFSAYLTWLELFEIEAICQWCVASAVVMVLVLALSTVRVVRFGGTDSMTRFTIPPEEA
jgi:uncharacterized membrane protein